MVMIATRMVLMAVSTTWGLCVVLIGLTLLLSASTEGSSWEVSTTRPHMDATTVTSHTMTPSHSMDVSMRGMVMLHTATGHATRSAMLLA